MALDERDYMKEKERERHSKVAEAAGNTDDKVRDAQYRPKEFRRGDRLRIRACDWRAESASGEVASQSGGTEGPPISLVPWGFLLGTVFGFLLACLLALLEIPLFETGLKVARPFAAFFLTLKGM